MTDADHRIMPPRRGHNNMKLVHWPLMGGLLHFVQRGGACAGRTQPRPLLAVGPTKWYSTPINGQCKGPIAVFLYIGPLLCGFNVRIKRLSIDFCDFCLIS